MRASDRPGRTTDPGAVPGGLAADGRRCEALAPAPRPAPGLQHERDRGPQGPIERAANELIDGAVDSGRIDVAADYGFLLPAYVLSDFMGVHPEDRNRVVQWTVDFVDFFNVIPMLLIAGHVAMRNLIGNVV